MPAIPALFIQTCLYRTIKRRNSPEQLGIVKHRLNWHVEQDVEVVREDRVGEDVHTREGRRLAQDMPEYLPLHLVHLETPVHDPTRDMITSDPVFRLDS